MEIQKAVRDYLRAADIVIDLLKNNGHVSDQERTMLQAYNARMQSFLVSETQAGRDRHWDLNVKS
jgi:hypothetical protein